MLFTHDTEVSLMGAAALVNTMEGSVPGDDDVDRLTTPHKLDAFYGSWQWTGSRAEGEQARAKELRDVRALRPRLRELWFLDEDGAVDAVNALPRDGPRGAARHEDGRRVRDGPGRRHPRRRAGPAQALRRGGLRRRARRPVQ